MTDVKPMIPRIEVRNSFIHGGYEVTIHVSSASFREANYRQPYQFTILPDADPEERLMSAYLGRMSKAARAKLVPELYHQIAVLSTMEHTEFTSRGFTSRGFTP